MGVPRRLLSVALLPSGELVQRIDALRRLLGDPRRFDLPSHLTLIPPISIDPSAGDLVTPLLREAAAGVQPFSLRLGCVDTFAPRTPTLHLRVSGDLDRLRQLRDGLRSGPFDRPDRHDFVPHLTLVQVAHTDLTAAGELLLSGDVGQWDVDSVVLLERLSHEGTAIWCPILEEPLGGAAVVGRGGVELHLRTARILAPGAAELLGMPERRYLPPDGDQLVVSAELPDVQPGLGPLPVGAAIGRAGPTGSVLERVSVAPGHRRSGVARHTAAAWIHGAASRGAGVVVARDEDAGSAEVLTALGFSPLDAATWCRRV